MEEEASFLSRLRGASAEMMPTVFLFPLWSLPLFISLEEKKGGRAHFVRLARQNVLNVDAIHMFKSLPVPPLSLEHLYVFLSPSLCVHHFRLFAVPVFSLSQVYSFVALYQISLLIH